MKIDKYCLHLNFSNKDGISKCSTCSRTFDEALAHTATLTEKEKKESSGMFYAREKGGISQSYSRPDGVENIDYVTDINLL